MSDVLILGRGEAAREAARHLPDALVLEAPAWHAEPGLVWVEDAAGVRALPFARLLVLEDAPLLLAALGCTFDGGVPVVDERGETSVTGVFAAGAVLGAADAVAQARSAALAMAGRPIDDTVVATARPLPAAERVDPVEIAGLLEDGREPEALAQAALLGPLHFARPVGLAALAALASERPASRPAQTDAGEPA
ncbi:hypothetical protein GXW74_12470 [Roseomonas eburnea]|uniref:Uncharacterized protein n=1 Tax=Neoroseomonas eburnea TaxID=1346889 RepID=A0A9X9XC66_9PROT|nr:hypothetical protein [Neoroseomonas eburnea]MBR0681302.1 hypothetical protein [Neoroseomonas eburnea]